MIGLDEKTEEEVREFLAVSTDEEVAAAKKYLLAVVAREEFTVEGFKAFVKVCYGWEILPHMEEAVEELFKTHRIVAEAYVESAKTTTLSEEFFAYFIGHYPKTASMLIQVSDSKAEETADAVSRLIMDNDNWKIVFPHIVPALKPWGKETGYQVKATRIREENEDGDLVWKNVSDAEWTKEIVGKRDPTFVGYGYKNRAIVGKRIDGLLIVDDIHDENNSFSALELLGTLRRLRSTIMSRAKKTAWRIFVGTPWVEGDAMDYAKGLSKYKHIFIPVYTEVAEGTADAFYWPRIDQWVLPAWPDQYDLDYLEEKWEELGEADFARMLLLDLTKTGDRVFYFQEYDHEKISPTWPTCGGVDFASILKESQRNDSDRAYYAQAYVSKLPQGGAVVTGGIRSRCTPYEAEEYMLRAQKTHPHWLGNIVEQDGKGEVFIFGLMQRHPDLVFIPMLTHGKGKEKRLEREMSPWFANGMVKISTADDPFLNALRKEMHDYPHSKHTDCLDAVYWALRGMTDVLVMVKEKNRLPRAKRKQGKRANPYSSLGRS